MLKRLDQIFSRQGVSVLRRQRGRDEVEPVAHLRLDRLIGAQEPVDDSNGDPFDGYAFAQHHGRQLESKAFLQPHDQLNGHQRIHAQIVHRAARIDTVGGDAQNLGDFLHNQLLGDTQGLLARLAGNHNADVVSYGAGIGSRTGPPAQPLEARGPGGWQEPGKRGPVEIADGDRPAAARQQPIEHVQRGARAQ